MWHHRLDHAPLITIQRLAKRGILPKELIKVKKKPLCAACIFAQAHKRGRTGRGPLRSIRKEGEQPGDATSADHIISHQPGIMPQVTGIISHRRYGGAILFVDHSADFIFLYLMESATTAETMAAKFAYERVAKSYGVKVKAWRADILSFDSKQFQESCHDAGQTYTYCGVGAHHENALAETKIKTICYAGRTLLLHAKRK